MLDMEAQFQDLRKRLGGDKEIYAWLEKAFAYESLAINELRRAGLDCLATSKGLLYIKEKFPCPNSLRNHWGGRYDRAR